MKNLIVTRKTKSYKIKNMYLSLDSDVLIHEAEMNITNSVIDGRQKRFLDSAAILLFEEFNEEITFTFSLVIKRGQLLYIEENQTLATTIETRREGKNIKSDVFIDSVIITGEVGDIYTVDISLTAVGQVHYN